ncbi:helix-turn-helix domain-containing protein [Chitinophaga nivalis]|uniref:Helix-turn-helix domain-containing protein n=1 Tax=Chitinophaga nivalis TaxID=2991709 RepID=A0ABT3IW94_9BACT|nr:helix-turn-helix transcriptional regulator [Chitinophaga nivalis]MCW3462061.1 helix-turn-helix domain-containing protein [Chitinophaga nivalis]MCW3488247.1 helix-turn-helix domain-containing protein [Chitinophaga nivalis]
MHERANQIKQEFGEKLRKLRKGKKLSMRQLALLADIDHSQIRKIEIGAISPTVPTLYSLAEALGITPCDFFDC